MHGSPDVGVGPRGDPAPKTVVTLLRVPVLAMPGALATHGPVPPIGVAYVAAALREAGHTVQLIDGAGEAIDHLIEIDTPIGTIHQVGMPLEDMVDQIRPDATIIGITTMFLHEWPAVRELAAMIRKARPDVFIVVGGENGTAFHRWMLEQSEAIDCCVLGEGETTAVELCDRLAAGRSLAGLQGIARRASEEEDAADGALVDTGLSIRMTKKEVNSVIPRPAWDLVPLEKYWEHYPFLGVDRGRSMSVLGTRGCPYKCSFCSSPQMWTTKYVVREPEDVVDEFAEYVERYGAQNFNFVDLTAATNRRWTLGLCDALEERLPDVTWQLPLGTRIEAIDREVLQRIYETGCRNVTFAPESGSQRMLDIMDKRVKLDHVLQAVVESREIGLHTSINIIIGHPEERWSDVWKSYKFMLKNAWLGCRAVGVMMFCPYPGSADFESLVASGRHVVDEASYYMGLARGGGRSERRSWNDRMSARQLAALQLFMLMSFYAVNFLRRPGRVFEFIKAQVTGSEETYLDQMIRTKRKKFQPVDESKRRSKGADPSVNGHRAPENADVSDSVTV